MAEAKYNTKEQNNRLNAQCPNCSRLYAMTDEKGGPQDVPNKCKRCGSPMDFVGARKFADENAEREHNPALAKQGAKMRQEKVPA